TYQVEISDITDKIKKGYKGEDEQGLDFQFTILDEPHRGRRLWKWIRPVVVPSLSMPSWLYVILEKTYNQPTAQEAAENPDLVDLHGLIGKQLRVVVNQKHGSDGK